jgi:ATP-dependent Clp protease adapter protein ClpS
MTTHRSRPCFVYLVVLAAMFGLLSLQSLVVDAFSVVAPLRSVGRPLYMAGSAQPEVEVKTKTTTVTKQGQKVKQTQKSKTDDPVSRRDDDFQEAPMFKLMLLADNGYDAEHVILRLCAIIGDSDDMDEDQAATIFQQAQQEGKAMCGKYPFERAELFKEQLLRSNPMIFAEMEEE